MPAPHLRQTAGGNGTICNSYLGLGGALTWISIEWLKYGKPSGLGAITGMVAGLATITPASGSVGPAGALLVGLSGGVICYYSMSYLKQGFKIDDSLDVFRVHGVGGIVGTFLAGILVSADLGIFLWQRPGSGRKHRLTGWSTDYRNCRERRIHRHLDSCIT